ncbi:uncharacterized protein LOC134675897 [Cydia fagiglandana]|uniref:uncharacterized protein LOC134675897 n=1 Tax=Cydia fagiglandana TaxID=1458189 RepID=UPI002FEE11E4
MQRRSNDFLMKLVKMEKDNGNKDTSVAGCSSINLGTIKVEETETSPNVIIKTEPTTPGYEANSNENVKREIDIKPSFIKTEPPDEHVSVTATKLFSKVDFNPKRPKLEVKNDEPNVKHEDTKSVKIEPTNKGYRWNKLETSSFVPNYYMCQQHQPPRKSWRYMSVGQLSKNQRRKRNKLSKPGYPEKQDRVHREATAIRMTRLIMELDMDKGVPNPGFDAYVFDRIKEHVHERFKKMFPAKLFTERGLISYLIKRYGEVYGMTYKDPILLKQVREEALMTSKPEETKNQPIETSNSSKQTPQDLQFQSAVAQVESDILSCQSKN